VALRPFRWALDVYFDRSLFGRVVLSLPRKAGRCTREPRGQPKAIRQRSQTIVAKPRGNLQMILEWKKKNNPEVL
jgi:hypothetical protein